MSVSEAFRGVVDESVRQLGARAHDDDDRRAQRFDYREERTTTTDDQPARLGDGDATKGVWGGAFSILEMARQLGMTEDEVRRHMCALDGVGLG